jgi:hypothetical protein
VYRTPLGKTFEFIDNGLVYKPTVKVQASLDIPQFKDLQLITYGAYMEGMIRDRIACGPPLKSCIVEFRHGKFTEPFKYLVNKAQGDTIAIQLPLEANDPMEEVVWFLRFARRLLRRTMNGRTIQM